MLRVVVDPGVLIAGLISRDGTPARILLRWRDGEFDLVVSPALVSELERILSRPKFSGYATPDETAAYVGMIRGEAIVVDDPAPQSGLTPDPGDDYLVVLARASGAAVLVSGDRHLTELPNPQPPVLTPRAFLERLDST
jgi:putative PIN family toxin of toxin-antitoxin system